MFVCEFLPKLWRLMNREHSAGRLSGPMPHHQQAAPLPDQWSMKLWPGSCNRHIHLMNSNIFSLMFKMSFEGHNWNLQNSMLVQSLNRVCMTNNDLVGNYLHSGLLHSICGHILMLPRTQLMWTNSGHWVTAQACTALKETMPCGMSSAYW